MFKGLKKKALLLLFYSLLSLSAVSLSTDNSSSESNHDKILAQVYDFEIALKAMDYLLDDKASIGVKLLKEEGAKHKKDSPEQPTAIFDLALGVMEFIEATLGFEPQVMERAHNTLSASEGESMVNNKYNIKHQLVTSHIYPPGIEFQVTYAELTLLNALLMLLQENNGVLEGARALFKLRKAYQVLDSIYKRIKELEPAFNKNIAKLRKEVTESKTNLPNISTVDLPSLYANSESSSTVSLPQDVKLMKNLEKVYEMRKSRIEGTNVKLDPEVNLFVDSTPSLTSNANCSKNTESNFSESRKAAHGLTSPSPLTEKLDSSPGDDSCSSSDENLEYSEASDSLNQSSFSEPNRRTQNAAVRGTSTESTASELLANSEINNHYLVSTTDEFIHSGVQLCFGILQVVLSLIPPAIGKVLSIVGFKGNRETGLKLLWRTAITSRNIHGELALLCLLVFYDGPVQFVDDGYKLPGDEDNFVNNVIAIDKMASVKDSELDMILKNPGLYIPQILMRARAHFSNNALWLLQEGRMLASQGKLNQAIDLMQSFTDNKNNKIQMQQIEALLIFDRAMLYAFKHSYDEAARDFIRLLDINSWSKSLYLFLAASCYLSKWRMIKMGLIEVEDKKKSLKHYGDLAEKFFKESTEYVPGYGSKSFLKKGGIGGSNKQMPFDKFVLRKLRHVDDCMKKYPQLSFLNCFGTSPIHELIYFWNGYNRMTEKEFKLTIEILGYSGEINAEYSFNNDERNLSKIEETQDEAMIRYFLQSLALRLLKEYSKGISLLDNHVISKYVLQDSPQAGFRFTRMTYSPYLYPSALYERALLLWLEKRTEENFNVKRTISECQGWLKKAGTVADIGDYELSSRTGMRIKAAEDRLDQINLRV